MPILKPEDCSISGCKPLPFYYKGQEYNRCTFAGHNQPWCYTNGYNWKNCDCSGAHDAASELLDVNNGSKTNNYVNIDVFSFIAGIIFCIGVIVLICMVLWCAKNTVKWCKHTEKVQHYDGITNIDSDEASDVQLIK
eukprot:433410_1